jgi:hypothetical protein
VGTEKKDRHKKWKEKQVAEGKKPITIMVSSHVKELIDREKKRTGSTIASIIERAVINHVAPSAAGSTSHKAAVQDVEPQQLPTEDVLKIVDDLKGIVLRIEKISGIENVTNHKLALTSDDFEELVLKHPNGRAIIRLVSLQRSSGSSPVSIVSMLNHAKHRTFRGGDKWTEKDIEELYKEFDTKGLHIKLSE